MLIYYRPKSHSGLTDLILIPDSVMPRIGCLREVSDGASLPDIAQGPYSSPKFKAPSLFEVFSLSRSADPS